MDDVAGAMQGRFPEDLFEGNELGAHPGQFVEAFIEVTADRLHALIRISGNITYQQYVNHVSMLAAQE